MRGDSGIDTLDGGPDRRDITWTFATAAAVITVDLTGGTPTAMATTRSVPRTRGRRSDRGYGRHPYRRQRGEPPRRRRRLRRPQRRWRAPMKRLGGSDGAESTRRRSTVERLRPLRSARRRRRRAHVHGLDGSRLARVRGDRGRRLDRDRPAGLSFVGPARVFSYSRPTSRSCAAAAAAEQSLSVCYGDVRPIVITPAPATTKWQSTAASHRGQDPVNGKAGSDARSRRPGRTMCSRPVTTTPQMCSKADLETMHRSAPQRRLHAESAAAERALRRARQRRAVGRRRPLRRRHLRRAGRATTTPPTVRSDGRHDVQELGGTGGPVGCGNDDQVDGDNESLEGSDGPDLLIGDGGDSFLGHAHPPASHDFIALSTAATTNRSTAAAAATTTSRGKSTSPVAC